MEAMQQGRVINYFASKYLQKKISLNDAFY